MEPKSNGKSMLTSKFLFSKKHCKTHLILMIFEVQGIEVGSKHPSKINKKTESKTEYILASIFDRF